MPVYFLQAETHFFRKRYTMQLVIFTALIISVLGSWVIGEVENGENVLDNEICGETHEPYSCHENFTVEIESKIMRTNILSLHKSGDPYNRVDVVFMGDGYTEAERSEFFADMNRLVDETLKSPAFSEFLPLMNIWAVFTPSYHSGISYPGRQRSTFYNLHRKSLHLRNIYVGNPARARTTCRQVTPSWDYPVLIGNDDYYGGLGGEFAISTSSHTSGSIVLRHELGHNFARVGEEYDRGQVYKGVNTAQSLRNVPWKKWVEPEMPLREEKVMYRVLAYPTSTNLENQRQTFLFTSSGGYSGWILQLSLSGAPETDSMQFFLDGVPLPWHGKGVKDKSFYEWRNQSWPLTKGRHNLTVACNRENLNSKGAKFPLRALGAVAFYEVGNSTEYRMDNTVISAYPTWAYNGRKYYRPTGNGCLMRNMTYPDLCSVCKESIWLQFLRKVNLIEGIDIEKDPNPNTDDDLMRSVTLRVPELGQFRKDGTHIEGERLEIMWLKEGREEDKGLRDKINIKARVGQKWGVKVKFVTPRIRNDDVRVTEARRTVVIK